MVHLSNDVYEGSELHPHGAPDRSGTAGLGVQMMYMKGQSCTHRVHLTGLLVSAGGSNYLFQRSELHPHGAPDRVGSVC